MTMDIPANMLETKKYTGRYEEYHRGCSFDGAIRNRAPREDWCKVDNTTPKMVSTSVRPTMKFLIFLNPSHSNAAGEYSIKRTFR